MKYTSFIECCFKSETPLEALCTSLVCLLKMYRLMVCIWQLIMQPTFSYMISRVSKILSKLVPWLPRNQSYLRHFGGSQLEDKACPVWLKLALGAIFLLLYHTFATTKALWEFHRFFQLPLLCSGYNILWRLINICELSRDFKISKNSGHLGDSVG